MTFDPGVVAHTTAQAEFVRPIWRYLASAVTKARIERGRAKAAQERAWLAKAETTYGVDRSVVMGIWGMETEFGAFEGSDYVIRALASLAFVHYSGDYFRDELIAALAILQEGDIERSRHAGLVGRGDGPNPVHALELHSTTPSISRATAAATSGTAPPDAIGSTANYLAKHGWIADAPWGFEARLPAKFKLTDADSSRFAPFASFAARGVVRADGHPLPRSGEAELLIPAGLHGPIFLVTANFKTIKSYNNSTAYALGVALLGDAIMGRGGLRARWPIRDPQLGERDVRDMQTRLRDLGYDVGRSRRPGRRDFARGVARLSGIDRRAAGRLSDPGVAAEGCDAAADRDLGRPSGGFPTGSRRIEALRLETRRMVRDEARDRSSTRRACGASGGGRVVLRRAGRAGGSRPGRRARRVPFASLRRPGGATGADARRIAPRNACAISCRRRRRANRERREGRRFSRPSSSTFSATAWAF